jgi:predicted nucleic acid-binding protein
MIFCDTSAIAKLYVPESRSPAMRARLESEDQVWVSELARVELMSVFHRQLRERRWSREAFLVAVRQFSNDDVGGFWSWLPVDPAIIDAASRAYATLPEPLFLRAADAIHLLTALRHGFGEIFTYDAHQAAAAAALGLKAANA